MQQPSRESTHDRDGPGFLARLLHRPSHEDSAESRTYPTANGETITITCAGCGAASEVDVERGRAAHNLGAKEGYFSRQCPHCGQETVAIAERRPF